MEKDRGIIIIGADVGQGKTQAAMTLIGKAGDKLMIHHELPSQETMQKIAKAMGIGMAEVAKAFAFLDESMKRSRPPIDELVMQLNSIKHEECNPSLYHERNDNSPKAFGMRRMGTKKFR